MKKTKILIFGKKSFVGSNLFFYLKKNYIVKIADFNKKNLKNLKSFDYIINCSTNRKYLENRYSKKNDHDLQIAKKIEGDKTHLLFLSSRKIYKAGPNLRETSKIECIRNYEKNKYITEKEILKIKKKNSTILRVSNLIGFKKRSKRTIHNIYLESLLKRILDKKIIDNKDAYKDFLDIKTFSKIIHLIIKNKVHGIFNVSIGKKIFLNDLNSWIIRYYKDKKFLKKIKSPYQNIDDTFYLNNSKLRKRIKINIKIEDLKNECFRLSKKLFK